MCVIGDAHQLIEQHLVHTGMRCLFALAGDLGETGGAGLAVLHDLIRSTCTVLAANEQWL
jgi:hypothetical protein